MFFYSAGILSVQRRDIISTAERRRDTMSTAVIVQCGRGISSVQRNDIISAADVQYSGGMISLRCYAQPQPYCTTTAALEATAVLHKSYAG